ncbi:MAG TPA: hypothetical protein VEK82_00560 [Stellaceae bacterium]|nr:hypothetical protein [Stellaceae bacterium]
MPIPCYAPLDEALDRLSGYGPTLANGNFNHAPMVAEALCALGQPEAVTPWIDRYQPRMLPRAPAGDPIRPDEWRDALGQRDRFAAWSRFFAEALREAAWREVLDLWAGRLAPGVAAAATHGAIRVGHAARSLGAGETPPRLAEFADALASWAASYLELPMPAGPVYRALPPRQALGRVPLMPEEQRRRPGNITAALARLGELPEFAPAVGLPDLDGAIDARLAQLTELFARIFLANAHDIPTTIAFVHGVTSLAALGHIAPHVGDTAARSLLRYGWQTGCGLYACYGGVTAFAEDIAPAGEDPDSLIERALANGDEHVIKFTEACLARHALAPSPAYPAAVAQVLTLIGRR